ncbi:unnamed protein product [Rotaria sp. Silwood1]|nr:unnamed protein product [Rotaria sp. Silwood1]
MSATSFKNKDGINVTRVRRNEKPINNGITSIEPLVDQSDNQSVPITRYSSVKVHRVSRILKPDEANERQNSKSPLIYQSPVNISRISVIKIPRNKIPRARSADTNLQELNKQRHSNVIYPNTRYDISKVVNVAGGLQTRADFDLSGKQKSRAGSLGSISVIKVKRPAVQVRPIKSSCQTSSSATVNMPNTNSRVNVTKVPRQQSKTRIRSS